MKKGNGFIKEYYDNGKIKFEGEYLNGEINGKGKEYYLDDYMDNVLKFEGEYLSGKKHGRGKKYDNNKQLIYEGEYIYDHKKKGKEFINSLNSPDTVYTSR